MSLVEGRVGGEVPARVVADEVHDRGARPPRVVEVREAVGEPRAEMEQRQGRAPRHAPVAVGGAGADALEEPEDRPQAGHPVERGHQGHLGGPGVGEAELEARRPGGPEQRFGAVHRAGDVAPESGGRLRWKIRVRASTVRPAGAPGSPSGDATEARPPGTPYRLTGRSDPMSSLTLAFVASLLAIVAAAVPLSPRPGGPHLDAPGERDRRGDPDRGPGVPGPPVPHGGDGRPADLPAAPRRPRRAGTPRASPWAPSPARRRASSA